MKIGCAAWAWVAEDKPYEWTVPEIARLGFEACGFQSDREGQWSVYDYFSAQKARELRALAADHGLVVSELVMWGRDLNSPDDAARAEHGGRVNRAVDLARELGTDLVNTTVPSSSGGRPSGVVKRSANLPADYSWADDWARYLASMAECVSYAERAGCSIMVEAFAGSICSTPDAFFRMAEAVGSAHLGWNLDTCHLDMQAQDVALAVHKLGDRILHTHIKDSEGLPAGMGRIDFEEVVGALRAVGYDGVLSIEAELFDRTTRYSRAAKAHIEAILDGSW